MTTNALASYSAMASAGRDPAAAQRLKTLEGSPDGAKVVKAAREFESFFISQMFEHMFSGISTDGPFGGGPSEGIWRSLLVTEMGKEISRRGGFGIADNVQAEMLRLQETGK